MRRIILSLILALSMWNINAQTENGLKAVEVLDSFEINHFTYFFGCTHPRCRDKDSYHAMIIGRGGMGVRFGEETVR